MTSYKCPADITINNDIQKNIIKSCDTCIDQTKCYDENCSSLDNLLRKYGWEGKFKDDNGIETTLKELVNGLNSKELISQVLFDRCNNVNCNLITDKFSSDISTYPIFLRKMWSNPLSAIVFIITAIVCFFIIGRISFVNKKSIMSHKKIIIFTFIILMFTMFLITSVSFKITSIFFGIFCFLFTIIMFLNTRYENNTWINWINKIFTVFLTLFILTLCVYTIIMISTEGSLSVSTGGYSRGLIIISSILLVTIIVGLIFGLRDRIDYSNILLKSTKILINIFMFFTMSPLYLPFLFIQREILGKWNLLFMNTDSVSNNNLFFNL